MGVESEATRALATTSAQRHLPWTARPHARQRQTKNAKAEAILAQDLAIQSYIADLTTESKPLSADNQRKIYASCYHFLEFIGAKVTTHAIYDMVQRKEANPNDTTVEKYLRIFKMQPNTHTHSIYTATVLGIFRRNFAPLKMHIHVQSNRKTLPISEPILLAIRNDPELSEEHRFAIDLMAYAGERLTALNKTPLAEIHLVENTKSALIDIPAALSKTGNNHPSVIPKQLAEAMIQNAQQYGYDCLLPNAKSIWARITQLAKTKHNVRLTSKYFRHRFQTVGSHTNANDMSPNEWTVLMGDRPKVGHLPDIYELMADTSLIHRYEQFLAPRLALSSDPINTTNSRQESEIELLKEQIAELTEQNRNLTRLLSRIAQKI